MYIIYIYIYIYIYTQIGRHCAINNKHIDIHIHISKCGKIELLHIFHEYIMIKN